MRAILSRVLLLCRAAGAVAITMSMHSVAEAQNLVSPAGAVVHAREAASFSGLMNGRPVANGFWYVNGTGEVGNMDQDGTYHAPYYAPASGTVTIGYYYSGRTVTTTATVVNPLPKPDGLNISSIHALSNTFLIHGQGFMPGATVSYNGRNLPVTYLGDNLQVQLTLSGPVNGPIALTVTNPAPGAASAVVQIPTSFSNTAVTPANAQVHAGTPMQYSMMLNGAAPSGGFFWIGGSGDVGWIDNSGVYYPPQTVPANPNITVNYYIYGSSTTTTATLVNPLPKITGTNVSTITQLSTPITVYGSGFLPTSAISVNGKAIPTTYQGYNQLSATIAFSSAPSGAVALSVTNPDPGGSSTSVSLNNGLSNTSVSPAAAQVHAGGTQQYAITINGATPTNGYWYVNGTGGGDNGYMDSAGVYHAPLQVPASPGVTIGYYVNNKNYETTATVTNPTPKPTYANVSTLTQLLTPMIVNGTGFLPSSVVTVGGVKQATTYVSPNALTVQVQLASATNGTIPLTVTNPDPGSSSGVYNLTGVFPGLTSVTPTTLASGWVTVKATGSGFTSSTLLMLDGKPMKTTVNSATSLTGVGYLPPWKGETSAAIGTVPQAGSSLSSSVNVTVTNATLSFDTAARFATQAAFGPRPGLVEHIQQVGLQGFLTEQMALPGVAYTPGTLPRYQFLTAAISGNSLLRLRVAQALSSYVVNQANDSEYQSYAPWETKLEADAFGNYRQLMTDMVSDAKLTDFLNLPGNYANMNDSSHPNQNFSREIMQLFTLGTSALNDDGSIQRDSSGNIIPTYDLNTILDMSRAFTGWNFGPLVNPNFTAFNIDFSQPLQAFDQYHDHGSKTLFGNVTLPAGQSITKDRDAALDAIFAQPSLPPYVVQHLIEQLVESNPSPAYISRVVSVFKDNGKGVRGDLGAVVQAILLDPEARAGDTKAATSTAGYLQDPLQWQLYVMNALQQTTWDGQAIYYPGNLGMDWWHAVSVFGFYPLQRQVPGTTINGPQFNLLNNLTMLHRSQYLYGIVTGSSSGFGQGYQTNSWLYNAFTNVNDLVDGLNHLLYQGRMSTTTQNAILSYCSGVSDQTQAFNDAIFLAMNADSVNVQQ